MNQSFGTVLRAPNLSELAIVKAAEALITQYTDLVGRDYVRRVGVWFDDLYDKVIYPEYEIELVDNEDLGSYGGVPVLGRYDVIPKTANIDRSLRVGSGDPRRTFTLFHEVGGHGVLQGEFLRRQLIGSRSPVSIVTTDDGLRGRTEGILEWQANVFAKHAAAPTWLVIEKVCETFSLKQPFRFVGRRKYGLYVRGTDLERRATTADELCRLIARQVQCYFWGLSLEALGYRIKECKLVVDLTRPDVPLRRLAHERKWRDRQTAGKSVRALVTSMG
ncbi:MAG: hypothetical protein V1790_00495 [Planctomycetota bacterium]